MAQQLKRYFISYWDCEMVKNKVISVHPFKWQQDNSGNVISWKLLESDEVKCLKCKDTGRVGYGEHGATYACPCKTVKVVKNMSKVEEIEKAKSELTLYEAKRAAYQNLINETREKLRCLGTTVGEVASGEDFHVYGEEYTKSHLASFTDKNVTFSSRAVRDNIEETLKLHNCSVAICGEDDYGVIIFKNDLPTTRKVQR